MPVIIALRRQQQENQELEACVIFMRPYLKNTKPKELNYVSHIMAQELIDNSGSEFSLHSLWWAVCRVLVLNFLYSLVF
jgi:hypothetical protein